MGREAMMECVPNVAEGRDNAVIDALAHACGSALLDVHRDIDHHRSVFTLATTDADETEAAIRRLALAVAERVDLSVHTGAHPRIGALDIVPFVALGTTRPRDAVLVARDFGDWIAQTLEVPVFFYAEADPAARSLPETRRDAFATRDPDLGPDAPHPRLGAVAVGARPPMVAVNLELDSDDVATARVIAEHVRERDGGLVGVRALGFELASRRRAQVSMNITDLDTTSVEIACNAVRERSEHAGIAVARVEFVGLVPADEYARTSQDFREWAGLGADQTIEARLDAQRAR
jgi:glutamate formiminotransferase / 5-formyltetrahydrofolate cyclo-ligase